MGSPQKAPFVLNFQCDIVLTAKQHQLTHKSARYYQAAALYPFEEFQCFRNTLIPTSQSLVFHIFGIWKLQPLGKIGE